MPPPNAVFSSQNNFQTGKLKTRIISPTHTAQDSFETTIFTYADIVIFSYFDNTHITIYDNSNNLISDFIMSADTLHRETVSTVIPDSWAAGKIV